jgi:hypothetical protein
MTGSVYAALPARRNHITQKVKIAGLRTLYLSVHDDARPAEIFLRLKGPDCYSELIGLYDVIARLISRLCSTALPLKVGDLLAGAKFTPCGPVSGHDHLTLVISAAASQEVYEGFLLRHI